VHIPDEEQQQWKRRREKSILGAALISDGDDGDDGGSGGTARLYRTPTVWLPHMLFFSCQSRVLSGAIKIRSSHFLANK
jgi:hypothetical protein